MGGRDREISVSLTPTRSTEWAPGQQVLCKETLPQKNKTKQDKNNNINKKPKPNKKVALTASGLWALGLLIIEGFFQKIREQVTQAKFSWLQVWCHIHSVIEPFITWTSQCLDYWTNHSLCPRLYLLRCTLWLMQLYILTIRMLGIIAFSKN